MLWQESLTELLELQARREVTADEILASLSARADAADPKVRAYIARGESKASAPTAPVLPIAIKDNLCTTDFPTTCASKILEGYRPPFDATAVELLRAAGAAITGKTNLDEFAMGSSTENSGFFKTRNPWDVSRVPGGSSGGSAAAVAAGMAPVALGTDTGGSVRQPAAYCGLVGIRPTYGLVSRYGLIAFASSLDQIGVLARTVEDCALVFGIIARYDAKDSTSIGFPGGAAFVHSEVRRPQKVSVGVIKEMRTHAGNEPCVDSNFEQSIRQFESLGLVIREVSIPHIGYSLDCYYLIAPAEASSNLARYDGVRYGLRVSPAEAAATAEGEQPVRDPLRAMFQETRRRGFGDEVKRRILIGTFVLRSGYYEAYYQKAMSLRKKIADEFAAAFREVDALLTPTTPEPAFRFGEKSESPLKMYLSDFYTLPAALAGIPALSFPSGFAEVEHEAGEKRRLPLSLQLMGRPFEELTLLRTAHAFGEATGLKNLLAPLDGGGG